MDEEIGRFRAYESRCDSERRKVECRPGGVEKRAVSAAQSTIWSRSSRTDPGKAAATVRAAWKAVTWTIGISTTDYSKPLGAKPATPRRKGADKDRPGKPKLTRPPVTSPNLLVLAAFASCFRSAARVVLEISPAGRSAIAGDLALFAVTHSGEATSFIRHEIFSSGHGWDRPKRIEPTRTCRKRTGSSLVGELVGFAPRVAVTRYHKYR